MSFLEALYRQRQELARVLSNPEYSGIREIVEELYPDRAHFIFELLQNAEDAGATEAHFVLGDDALTFEHNGRAFTEEDVRGITNIGKGTKRDQEDQIGCFGVGFKAVFAYSETPHVLSPTYSFKISELVLPTEIANDQSLGPNTRFKFPFNNPKKSAHDAYNEIKTGLEDLAETTLLFLSNLETIRWQIGEGQQGEIKRIRHSETHVEVLKQLNGDAVSGSHFLRFSEPVEGVEKQRIAVAFVLDFLPDVKEFYPGRKLAEQMRIVPAKTGRVAVFFPAEKETSGLRFHLHAPFVPELSRASIKETRANDPLFQQLAKLTASCLHGIHAMNLLTPDFLGVLPNSQDEIPERYQQIRAAVIAEMNDKPLTPTHSKSHAPARHLLQARASLKELLSPEDITLLVQPTGAPLQWAVAASQRNSNADRFLTGLAITPWDIDTFVETLVTKMSEGPRYISRPPWVVNEPDTQFVSWLAGKSPEWHQQLYALLYSEISAAPVYKRKQVVESFKKIRVVRVSDGNYDVGARCYFPGEGVEHDPVLPRVAAAVYSSGKNRGQQEEAKKFLEEIGVTEVGEAEQVQAILKQRYRSEAFRPDLNDLERLVSLVEKDPQQAKIFADYFIFRQSNNKWGKPAQLYIDKPFLDTGLSAFYDALGGQAPRTALSEAYLETQVTLQRFLDFAVKVGVRKRLRINKITCQGNSAVQELVWKARGNWSQNYGINRDYTIEHLGEIIDGNNEALSRLVWKTLCEAKDQEWLLAKYRNNSSQPTNEAASQLVCILREALWVPQSDGRFVRPSEALRELLPKGFPYDEGYEWLKAVRFGEDARKRSEEYKRRETAAKELGFADEEALERAKKFTAIPKADQERVLAEFHRRQQAELPEHEPANPERRAERVAELASDAPERVSEKRMRSVSVGVGEVKQETDPYLREQYTNDDGAMICQACKAPQPFKLDNGNYYFEKVEFLDDLTRRHYQNYLALCPNHSAMFQHANGSRKLLKNMFTEMKGNHLEIVLAQEPTTLYFTKTHIADLKAVIEKDGEGESHENEK